MISIADYSYSLDLLKEHSKLIRRYFVDFISDYDFHQLTATHEVNSQFMALFGLFIRGFTWPTVRIFFTAASWKHARTSGSVQVVQLSANLDLINFDADDVHNLAGMRLDWLRIQV